jgi:1,4-dihydroxy-2-naphthoyl-CoA hydrolase
MMTLADKFNERGAKNLPGHLGIHFSLIEPGRTVAEMPVRESIMSPNGFLHAGSVVTLADTCAGYGCASNLPEGATGFTTIELKSNHLGTAREGMVDCTATLVHAGRTTQVWDATVTNRETGKVMALFRCTQMILYPK